VGLDERSDLAVLRIDPDGLDLHPLRLGDSDAVQVGDPVMAIGAAAGMAPRLAVGLLSARQARLQGPGGAVMDGALQTDARLHEGDWGGPLLDESGRVIGVNTRMAIGDGTEAVELAVPANTARDVLSILRATSLKVVG
jgi:S1-C subfamily serine protease